MRLLQAFILGIVQGITEFLPISSSGHLALIQNSIGEVNVGFDVVVHVATLFAILIYFYKDIFAIVRDFFCWKTKSENFLLAWVLIIASVPIAVFGYLFRYWIYSLFENIFVVGIGLLISGGFLFLASREHLDNRKEYVGIGKGFVIGLSQALAIIPGISRSGITVSTGLLLGVEREKAVRFSFLLGSIAIFGAMLVNFRDLQVIEPLPFIFGFIGAFVAGFLAIFVFIKYLKINRLKYFAYYCWILGLAVLLMGLFV